MLYDYLPTTIGALLMGGLCSTLLSGGVSAQCLIYFNGYQDDKRNLKILALFVWVIDTAQTVLIWAGLWYYLIRHFGDVATIDTTPWNVACTTLLCSTITVTVHLFHAYRIYILSNRTWLIPSLVGILCIIRAAFAGALTAGFVVYPTFSAFKARNSWLLYVGLSILTATDVIVTVSLMRLLHKSRTTMTSSVNTTLARLGQYTLRTGIINFIGALTTLICWAAMSDNLVFISIFWTIPHLYANSFFAALNARAGLRRRQSMASTCPVLQTPIPKTSVKAASQSTNRKSFSLPCYMDWKVKERDSADSSDKSPRTSDSSGVTNWNNRPIAIKVETTSGIHSY